MVFNNRDPGGSMVASIWQCGAGIGMKVNCRHGTRRLAELITSENHDKHDINKNLINLLNPLVSISQESS